MPSKLKKIIDRALSIREKAGFTTETITKKRYKMAYIPDAIKQAAKELKSTEKPKRTKRVVKTKSFTKKAAVVVAPVKRTKRVVKTGVFKIKVAKSSIEKQYDELKLSRKETLFLFEHGDFYFSIKSDALTLSRLLNITLIKKNSYRTAGFPKYKLEENLPILVRAGLSVGIVNEVAKVTPKNVVRNKPITVNVKKAITVATGAPLVMKQERVRLTKKNFIRVSSKGKDFKATYGVTAMSVLKQSELHKNKYIYLTNIYEWMTKRKVTNQTDFYGKFIEEIAKSGKYLTGKRVVDIDKVHGYEFNHTDRMPPKGKAGMYGLDKIAAPIKNLTRAEYSSVFVDDGKLVATDAHKLIVIKDTENQAKKYNGKIVGIHKGNMNTIIDGRYPNYNAVLPQMDKQPHVTSWIEIDEVLPGLNGRVLILKSISGSTKYVVLSIKGNKVAVHANFLLDLLTALKANGAKKIKIGSSGASRGILIETDNGNTGLCMPIHVSDINDRDDFMLKQIKLN